jgi:hypothetical protein
VLKEEKYNLIKLAKENNKPASVTSVLSTRLQVYKITRLQDYKLLLACPDIVTQTWS